jgi:hypothetical protein
MKYDSEYNSFRFPIEQLIDIVNALTFYSRYSPLDKITKQNVLNLIQEFKSLRDIPIG